MVRRVPMAAAASAALLVVGLCAGYGGPKRAAVVSAYAAPALVWAACQNLPVPPHGKSEPPSTLECAKLAVPLDYAQPGGEKIRIALIRVKATDQAKRIGSLLFNFGGATPRRTSRRRCPGSRTSHRSSGRPRPGRSRSAPAGR